jgi:hypothetical protein
MKTTNIVARNSDAKRIIQYSEASAHTTNTKNGPELVVELKRGPFLAAQVFCTDTAVQSKLESRLNKSKGSQEPIMPPPKKIWLADSRNYKYQSFANVAANPCKIICIRAD